MINHYVLCYLDPQDMIKGLRTDDTDGYYWRFMSGRSPDNFVLAYLPHYVP